MSGLLAMSVLTRREFLRLARQPSRLIATLGTAALLWAFLAGGFADALNPPDQPRYALFLLPGMAMMVVTFGAIFGAIALIQDRHSGFLQSVLASPAPAWSIVASRLLAVGLIAGAQAALVLGASPFLGARSGLIGFTLAALGAFLGAIGVGGLSLALAWKVDSTEGFHGVMNIVLLPMWLLSGAFFPADSAHPALRAAMAVNPLRWTTDAVRAALDGGRVDTRAWIGALGFALASSVFAWIAMGLAIQRRTRPAPGALS